MAAPAPPRRGVARPPRTQGALGLDPTRRAVAALVPLAWLALAAKAGAEGEEKQAASAEDQAKARIAEMKRRKNMERTAAGAPEMQPKGAGSTTSGEKKEAPKQVEETPEQKAARLEALKKRSSRLAQIEEEKARVEAERAAKGGGKPSGGRIK